MSELAAKTHYARPSSHARKPSTSTKRLCPTGHNLQAEMSLPHSFTSHYVWAGSGWAPRYTDTPERHGQLGDPSFPPSWRPPNPRTSNPCSPPRPSYGANSTNYKLRYHNKWTNPNSFSSHWAWHSVHTGQKKTLVNTIQQVTHQQLLSSLSTNTIQKAILISQTAQNTGAHLQQPNSEAYEADDRCFQVSLARRLMLPHPAASHSANTSTIINYTVRSVKAVGGVDQRHSALARCLADLITTHTSIKAHIEQSIPGLTHTNQNGQTELARMDIVVALRVNTYYIDTAIVTPFSSNVNLITATSARPGYMAKREEKKNNRQIPPHQPGSSHPQGGRDTTPENSSNTSTTTRTTHQQPSLTPGRPSRPHYTTAFPNNSFEQSLRDRLDPCPTHATSFHHPRFPALVATHATLAHMRFPPAAANSRSIQLSLLLRSV